jgi:hypothetical protein
LTKPIAARPFESLSETVDGIALRLGHEVRVRRERDRERCNADLETNSDRDTLAVLSKYRSRKNCKGNAGKVANARQTAGP